MEDVVVELSKKYNKKEEVIEIMIEKSVELGYNTIEAIGLINNYYSCQFNLSKTSP